MANRNLKSQQSINEHIRLNTEFYSSKVPIPHSETRCYEFVVKKRYQDLVYINEGSQGSVVSATDSLTGAKVAIKRVELSPFQLKFNYREIELLTRVNHMNVIKVSDIFTPVQTQSEMTYFYIVMEFMDGTLSMIDTELTLDHIRAIIGDVICAVHYLQENNIIHRDLKPGNIGIDHESNVKLLDFGLATFDSNAKMTKKLGTRAYKAPELWLGVDYDKKIDSWSIGCILAEMCTKISLFKVNEKEMNDDRHLNRICEILGSPNFTEIYPKLSENTLKRLATFPTHEQGKFDEIFSNNAICKEGGEELKSLLKGLLEFNPEKRMSAEEALNHSFFNGFYTNSIAENKENPIPTFNHTENYNLVLKQGIWEIIQEYK